MTDAEKKLWWRLRQLPMDGTHFRRQAPVGPYYADFACHKLRVVIEIDGSQHATPASTAADEKRTAYLNAAGYRVLRFWNNEVLQDIEAVMTAIYAVLAESAPHPQPLPATDVLIAGR